MSLSEKELVRYERQLRIHGLGREEQLKLKKASILVAGVGGLGSIASIYLAIAGFGRIVLVDKEVVELSNLNRQMLYTEEDIGEYKALKAAEKLRKLNPNIEVEPIVEEISEKNVEDIVGKVDIVVDGQDNFRTRFLINEACIKQG